MATGASGMFPGFFDENFLGDPAAQGHGDIRTEVFDKDGAAKDAAGHPLDLIANIKSHRKKPSPHAFSASDFDNPQRFALGGFG
jgi:hypothetical protein